MNQYCLPLIALLLGLSVLVYGADEKIRVYVTDSDSWAVSGGFYGNDGTGGGSTRGGARPQTAEIIKTFNERCPELTVSIRKEKANYVILLDHEGGKGIARKDNKVAVFNEEGDAIFSGSTRSLGNSIKDACKAIREERKELAQSEGL